MRELATSSLIRALVEPILGPNFFPVRGILFDKIPGANLKVPWHQDVTIAVQEKIEAEGFGPWSMCSTFNLRLPSSSTCFLCVFISTTVVKRMVLCASFPNHICKAAFLKMKSYPFVIVPPSVSARSHLVERC